MDKTTERQNALVGEWGNDHNNEGTWEEPPGPACSGWRRMQQCGAPQRGAQRVEQCGTQHGKFIAAAEVDAELG